MAVFKTEKKLADYQQKLQMQLNAQQQQYAEKNAYDAYQRTLQYETLKPQLQKDALVRAGISSAGYDSPIGSTSVSQASASSGGNAPNMANMLSARRQSISSLLGNVQDFAGSLSDLALSVRTNRASVANMEQDTIGKRIDNTYKAAEKIAAINKMVAEKQLTQTQGEIAKNDLYISEHTKDTKIRQTELDAIKTESEISLNESAVKLNDSSTQLNDARSKLTDTQNKYLDKELSHYEESFNKHMEFLDSQIFKNEQSGWLDQSKSWLTDTQRYAQEIVNKIEEQKLPYISQYAEQFKNEVNAAITKAETDIQNIENQAKQLEFETEHQRAEFIAEQVKSYMSAFGGMIGSAFGAFFGAKQGGKSFSPSGYNPSGSVLQDYNRNSSSSGSVYVGRIPSGPYQM